MAWADVAVLPRLAGWLPAGTRGRWVHRRPSGGA